MAMFVHLTPESQAARIRREGIRCPRRAKSDIPGGIFAFPVTNDFFVSHQWIRELRRRNKGSIVGVYFRIPDRGPVWIGHYQGPHRLMSAAEAVATAILGPVMLGWEVLIARSIKPHEVHRIKGLPQLVGWRYFPEAKGRRPFCTCRFCTHGMYDAQALRKRFGKSD